MGARGGGSRKMAAAGGTAGRSAAVVAARLPLSACLLAAAASLAAVKVSAVEVTTPEEMFVENETDVKLPCTFTSAEVISSAASVSWSFQPEGAATRISGPVIYAQLDHSGGQHSDKINKSESVVYADIRKN
uniref:Myelin protein zero like 1 n=1 Tax=Gallus gallus TaxID=9031 RepID=A0A8V0Y0N4_CHICK